MGRWLKSKKLFTTNKISRTNLFSSGFSGSSSTSWTPGSSATSSWNSRIPLIWGHWSPPCRTQFILLNSFPFPQWLFAATIGSRKQRPWNSPRICKFNISHLNVDLNWCPSSLAPWKTHCDETNRILWTAFTCSEISMTLNATMTSVCWTFKSSWRKTFWSTAQTWPVSFVNSLPPVTIWPFLATGIMSNALAWHPQTTATLYYEAGGPPTAFVAPSTTIDWTTSPGPPTWRDSAP